MEAAHSDRIRRRRLTAAIIVVAALLVAVIVWLLLIRDDDSGSEAGGTFEQKTQAELQEFAGSAGHEVYWAGPQPDARYELFEADDGRIYVRYLTGDGVVGDPRPNFLTVGTYPVTDAVGALRLQSEQPGNRIRDVGDGGVMLVNRAARQHVYVAYPNSDYQVEVFDPKPNRAEKLVTSGKVVPIG